MSNKDEFILEMNEIKPREELLEDTINLIRKKELKKNEKKFNINKIVISITALLGITTTCFAGYEILSKRFKSTDMMGISMEMESDEEFQEGYYGDFATLYSENNDITVYKDKKIEDDELNDSEESFISEFENLKEDGYKTLKSGTYGYYREGELKFGSHASDIKEYYMSFSTEQEDDIITIEIFINMEADNFKEIYEADKKMINTLKMDKILEQYYKDKYEEVVFHDIKFKVNSRLGQEQLEDNLYMINVQIMNPNEDLTIELYDTGEDLEKFYNDDIVLESIGYHSSWGEDHKYYYIQNNWIEDMEDIKTYMSTEEIKEIIKDKEKFGDSYYEGLNLKEGFKILSKQNIQKDGIKGIRYSYSYEGTDSPVTVYILSVKDKIYKLTLSKFNYFNLDRYDELQKVINSITLADE